MLTKVVLLVAAIALVAVAAAPSNSFAAAKKSKAEQSNLLRDSNQCSGSPCTAYTTPTYHYNRTRKVKHHQG